MMCLEIFGRQGGGAQYGPYRAPPLVQNDLQNGTEGVLLIIRKKPNLISNQTLKFVLLGASSKN